MTQFLLFINVTGVFLAMILFFFNRGYKTANRYLGIFFLLISFVNFFRQVILDTNWVYCAAIMLSLSHYMMLLIGPMAYFYVRSILRDSTRLYKWDYLHFVAFAVAMVGSIPFVIGPFEDKLHAARELMQVGLNIRKISVRYNVFFPNSFIVILRVTHFFVYMVAMWRLMWLNKSRFFDSKTAFGQMKEIKNWLLIFCITYTIFCFVTLVLVSLNFTTDSKEAYIHNARVFISFSILCYVSLIVSLFFHPKILYGFPVVNTSQKSGVDAASSLSTSNQGMEDGLGISKEYQAVSNLAPLFENDYVEEIKKSLDGFISDRKYLLSTCSIGFVADEIQIPSHHLSYYFNNMELISFIEWRNKFRILHASKLVQEGILTSITFQALGEQCGFSTNNTFIRAFKNHTGLSPSAFAKMLGESAD